MTFDKYCYLLVVFCCWLVLAPLSALAQETTLYQSVEQALAFSPQLQALAHNNAAIEHDLRQARARYRPSVDMLLGYGAGQYSDSVTRLPDADPSDTEWNSRGDATLRLTQKLYDGGETRQYVSIQKALLESADLGIQEAVQAITLDAINAHLDVYRLRKLVGLAEKDLEVHQNIYQALAEMEQAGTGNIADVTQTQTRIAWAQSILIDSQADLSRAIAAYERVVGIKPGELAFTEIPKTMPHSLEQALTWMEKNNPGLLARKAQIMEADARVGLARSAYKPKINIELSSNYHDQLEGDPSWQHSNDAMVVLRWNLYNGGQDKEGVSAALSRKYESQSNRDEKLIALREATASAWATYRSLQHQKNVYREAVRSSEKTFDAYLKQFSVGRRSLLDVLNTEKEYFQSARQLVAISADEITAAYRILNLGGVLQISQPASGPRSSADFNRLGQAIDFTPAFQAISAQPPTTAPAIPAEPEEQTATITINHLTVTTAPEATAAGKQDRLNSIRIHPLEQIH